MNLYGLRISKCKSMYDQSEAHKAAFKALSQSIYKEDIDILFAYGEIFIEEDSELTYAEAANGYTNFQFDNNSIESIDIIKINDINQVSIHPAYNWSDILFYTVSYYNLGDEYSGKMMESSADWISDGVGDALTVDTIGSFFEYDLNQIVFRRDLEGIEIVESITNTEDVDLFETINRLADKYKLLVRVKLAY